jgi:hypothetical protein
VLVRGGEEVSTIYVVTQGEGSDYGIVAVFSERARANELVQRINSDQEAYWSARVEEYDLDPDSVDPDRWR